MRTPTARLQRAGYAAASTGPAPAAGNTVYYTRRKPEATYAMLFFNALPIYRWIFYKISKLSTESTTVVPHQEMEHATFRAPSSVS